MDVPGFPLNDGNTIPALGLGTSTGDYLGTMGVTTATHHAAISAALDTGYRHFNTAATYGTEAVIGEVIKEKINQGVIQREDVFICTKLWCTDHRRDRVVPALRKSLDELQLSYVDLYCVHYPMAMQPGTELYPRDPDGNIVYEDDITSLEETWQGMEECKELGLAKSIGVSNYNTQQLQRVLDSCTIKPAVNEVECHVHFAQTELVEYCATQDIRLVCYSPLGKPARPWKKNDDSSVFEDNILSVIAKNHGKTSAQVALRYLFQRGLISVPKSYTPARQRENIEIFDFHLSDDEMKTIFSKCDTGIRKLQAQKVIGESFLGSKEWPFHDKCSA